jgi:uncharacterized protein
VPRLGGWGAARLQRRFTLHALRTALAAGCGSVELHGTANHLFFKNSTRDFKIKFRVQRGGDLGERMHHSLLQGLRRHRAVILIGTDSPALRADDLRRAARLLAGGDDAVLAPAEDGGYALIGVKRISPRLFSGIEWGRPSVYAATVERLDLLQYKWRALRRVWDVDRPEDLERLRALRFFSASRRGARR